MFRLDFTNSSPFGNFDLGLIEMTTIWTYQLHQDDLSMVAMAGILWEFELVQTSFSMHWIGIKFENELDINLKCIRLYFEIVQLGLN